MGGRMNLMLRRRAMMGPAPMELPNPNFKITQLEIQENGKYITSTGDIEINSNYSVTDFYPLHGLDKIIFWPELTSNNYCGLYDINKNWLRSAKGFNLTDVAYVRFSSVTSTMVNAFMIEYNFDNYINGHFYIENTDNIKIVRVDKIGVPGKIINRSGNEVNAGSAWCISDYYDTESTDRIAIYEANSGYTGLYDSNYTWKKNINNRLVDGNVYFRTSSLVASLNKNAFAVLYNYERLT